MKALNLRSTLAVLFFAAITMVSCKKNNDDIAPAAAPIEGQWMGKYGSQGNQPDESFGFNILPNGQLQVLNENKAITGTGTWKLEDEQTFKAVYQYNNSLMKFNLAAKYDAQSLKITGSWGEGVSVADQGDFFLNKL